ncbi:MAG: BMP family ABC transporter substrate-binding protein [Clostridiales bacterium]|nr:BMP family ABC transporter substrate-binding protein [Clostridiales bacterium]
MKKGLVILLTLALIVGCLAAFTACSGEDYDLVVGAIYIGGKDETSGYTAAHANGIKKAIANLEKEGYKVKLEVVDKVDDTDYNAVAAACDTLVAKGSDIIFGISFGYLHAMNDKAAEYKDVLFSHATGYLSNDTNYNNYFGRIYQARYLSGIAAGLKSIELESDSIGYVAAWTTEYAETTSGINAFALGVQSVNPDATVYVKSIKSWGDTAKEQQAAQYLIDTYNCTVIAQHCDSAQPQIVAQENDVYGCGYNTDMTSDAPKAHLTAPIWNWHVYYQFAMEEALKDPATFVDAVGNYLGGLKEGFVDISPLSENCAPNTAKMIELARKEMVDGNWDVFHSAKLSFEAIQGEIAIKITPADLGTLYTPDPEKEDADPNPYVCKVEDDQVTKTPDYVITGTMNTFVAGVTDVDKM